MQLSLIAVLEAAVLASSLSLDSFTAGFAYGSKKIRIPMLSVQIITLICSAVTGLSLFAGVILKPYIPSRLTLIIAFAILFIIGATKLLDSITKSIIRKYSSLSKELKISMFNFKFILNVYADPECADADDSKTISPAEASALALSLSLDGMAVGFGAALMNVSPLAVFLWSLITNAAAIIIGCHIGNKIAKKLPFNISWISGAALIALAFFKFL